MTRARTPHVYRLGDPVTAREMEIVRLAADGSGNAEIAQHLHLSAETVRSHLHHVGIKIGCGSRAGAVGFAIRTGWMAVPVTRMPPSAFRERHFQVLVLIARGMSNEEIAEDLELTFQTVKSRVRRILQLLKVDSREAAVVAGFACGVLRLVPKERVAA